MTQQMPSEEVKKRGPVQPWQVVPSSDTPSRRAARAIFGHRPKTISVD